MTGTELDRMVIGVVCLCISLGGGTLLAIYWSMPSPRRAVAPAPVDRPGYTYTCYCYYEPVRVKILAPKSSRAARHGRHARTDQPPQDHRIRPHHVSRAGADGGGRGTVPVTVAA